MLYPALRAVCATEGRTAQFRFVVYGGDPLVYAACCVCEFLKGVSSCGLRGAWFRC